MFSKLALMTPKIKQANIYTFFFSPCFFCYIALFFFQHKQKTENGKQLSASTTTLFILLQTKPWKQTMPLIPFPHFLSNQTAHSRSRTKTKKTKSTQNKPSRKKVRPNRNRSPGIFLPKASTLAIRITHLRARHRLVPLQCVRRKNRRKASNGNYEGGTGREIEGCWRAK